MTNAEIATRLREHAGELARGHGSLYRVRAVRQAAMAVMGLGDEVNRLGRDRLRAVAGIGPSLAETITRYAETGEWEPRTPAR